MNKGKKLLVWISLVVATSLSYGQKIEKGVILVGTKAGVNEQVLDTELNKYGAKKLKKFDSINVYEVSVPVGKEKDKAAKLANNKHIKFAEANELVPPTYVSNDKYYTPAWHLHKMKIPDSWNISEGAGITIAIADSGVRVTHQDLAANISPIIPYNFVDSNTNVTDVTGHGTAVAGAAAAVTNNLLGVAGVAGKAKILPIRITNTDGWASYANMAKAITYAADKGVRVLNCSYGGGANSSTIQSAAAYMVSKGGVVVWSAGNDNADLGFYDNPNIILVSATDQNDVRTSWSSFGAYVDVAAPGIDIYVPTYTSDSSYGKGVGTSFSSPIIAGVVAQMLAVNPALTSKTVDSILKSTAVDLGTSGEDIYYGAGRVNALAAVTKARGTVVQDTTNPIVSFNNISAGKVLSGTYSISVAASDDVGVKEVAVYLTNTLIDYEYQYPYDFILDTTKFSNGNYTLSARAVDAAGNYSDVSTNVFITNGDVTPPKISIVNPVNNLIIPADNIKPVKITTSATDEMGTSISQKLYVNNVLKASAITTALNYSWKPPAPGTYTIRVDAFDIVKNKSSATITIIKQ